MRGDVEVITEGGGRGNKAGFTGHPERTGPLCTEPTSQPTPLQIVSPTVV